jgi:hypothetical protein
LGRVSALFPVIEVNSFRGPTFPLPEDGNKRSFREFEFSTI